MDLSFNLAPSYRDLKDPTSRQNFEDTVEQKRVIDLRACHILHFVIQMFEFIDFCCDFFISHYLNFSSSTSGETLCCDNRQLIGTPLIVIARQSQQNRD